MVLQSDAVDRGDQEQTRDKEFRTLSRERAHNKETTHKWQVDKILRTETKVEMARREG
jgi:hypothetical protein